MSPIKVYLGVLLTSLAAVAVLNAETDVGGLGAGSFSYQLARLQTSHQLIVSEKAIDMRSWLKARLAAPNPTPQLLVLGSSTVGQLDSEQFSPLRFLNGYLSEPMPEDLEAITTLLEAREARPTVIVLGIDHWFFNSAVNNDRWTTLLAEQAAFERTGTTFAPLRRLKLAWQRGKERLSFEATRESAAYWLHRSDATGPVEARLTSDLAGACANANATTPLWVRHFDGHYVLCSSQVPSNEEVLSLARTYVTRNFHQVRTWGSVDSQRFGRLARVLQVWRQLGIQVVLVAPPYHPAAYAELLSADHIRENFQQMDRRLTELSAQVGAIYLNARNPSVPGCVATEFTDSHHSGPSCARKVARLISARLQVRTDP